MAKRSSVFVAFTSVAFAAALLGGAACGGGTPPPEAPKSTTTVTDPADQIPMDSEGEDIAFLDITSAREVEILLDGKSIGKTPLELQKVTPGTHEVTFVDERGGNRTLVVTVGPGESQTVSSNANPTSADAILAPPKDGKK
jgi:hypothetical protein